MRRIADSSSAGLLLGLAAGTCVGLADFGAQWMWLVLWSDRAWFLLRVLATLAPLGAIAGAVLGACAPLAADLVGAIAARLGRQDDGRRARWVSRLAPLPWIALASPALGAVAWLLFTGGSASKITMRPLAVCVAFTVLAA
ncbi:MAG: hypothetical protein IT379_41300, partial [Deltaproteobacteria bacterium]|nr:hypothetical protein [Deltaproteobacteria bacterium]